MDKIIYLVLPILLILALYVFILTRKGEVQRAKVSFKGFDWMTYFGVIFASSILGSSIHALNIEMPLWFWFVFTIILILVIFFIVIRRVKTGKPIIQRMGDERINEIYAKSSRNALFTTYSVFFVHSIIVDVVSVDEMWVTIMLGGGLMVFLASIYFYYYRKS